MASGVDIVNDGEQPRVGLPDLCGATHEGVWAASRSGLDRVTIRTSPSLLAPAASALPPGAARCRMLLRRIAEVRYEDLAPAEDECRMFPLGAGQAANRHRSGHS